MREHTAGRTSLARLAQQASLSPSHFSARFRERFGFAPMDYFLRLKIQRATRLLDATTWPVARVAEEVGFADPLYFSRRFRAVMGVSRKAIELAYLNSSSPKRLTPFRYVARR